VTREPGTTLIREAVIREWAARERFFVHNFVHENPVFRRPNSALCGSPHPSSATARARDELENEMVKFIGTRPTCWCVRHHRIGSDIPKCNTSSSTRRPVRTVELHHSAGGRPYKHRVLLSAPVAHKPITPTAAMRLKAIEEDSDLERASASPCADLEFRGARSDILGPVQSGHIARRRLRALCLCSTRPSKAQAGAGRGVQAVILELDVQAHIPRSYIESDRHRMEIYRGGARPKPGGTRAACTDLLRMRSVLSPTRADALDLAEIRVPGRSEIRTITPSRGHDLT
jgi:transcription-repair coupling factor (superfamily II helicase)